MVLTVKTVNEIQCSFHSIETKVVVLFLARWKVSQMATAPQNAQALSPGNKPRLYPLPANGRRDQLDLQRRSSRRQGFTLTCTRLRSKF